MNYDYCAGKERIINILSSEMKIIRVTLFLVMKVLSLKMHIPLL